MTNDELEAIARLKPQWLLIHTGFDRLGAAAIFSNSSVFINRIGPAVTRIEDMAVSG
jgi:hypothetical protein